MKALKQALIGYGAWLMARQLGRELPRDGPLASLIGQADFTTEPPIERARRLLGDWSGGVPESASPGRLRSVFSFVYYEDRKRPRVQADMPHRALDISLDNPGDQVPEELWEGFWDCVGRLKPGWGLFETFTALMARYGWNLPGTLESEGVSVFEQFKAVTSLAHVLIPDRDEALLVGGDLPGIQDMLYTITSKGVAKALRGRSFYLQLLNDAIVRALLRDLDLPSTCVVYNAGGNFQILARITDGERLETLRREVNHRLLALHGGELFLALAWTPVRADDLATSTFADTVEELADRVEEKKSRAFADLAEEDYEEVFGATGFGGLPHCEICHVDLEDNAWHLCDQCDSFGERMRNSQKGLARRIADTHEHLFLAVHDLGGFQLLEGLAGWNGKPPWWTVLRSFGYRYDFAEKAEAGSQVYLYALNETDCVPGNLDGDCAYGFRFLANTTPRLSENEDLKHLQSLLDPDEGPIEPGDIRSTTIMARWDRAGIDRYAVLRMDVDNLGTLFATRLVVPSLLYTSALSAALGVFFEGWLNNVCKNAADEWQRQVAEVTDDPHSGLRVKLPYVIYAGGDDLLIVGPWDVLPVVARQVRRDLGSYVLRGYVAPEGGVDDAPLTVSAGIFAETAKFPLYQAAEQAGEALDAAKRRKARRRVHGEERLVTVKDAVNLLETTVGWEEFKRAEELALKLARMVDVGIPQDGDRTDTAPHALVQLLAAVAREYAKEGGEVAWERLPYGRWMPLLAYGLRRMVDRAPAANPSLRQEIMGLARDALDLTRAEDAAQWYTIRFLGLPVRWAEFLIRKGG